RLRLLCCFLLVLVPRPPPPRPTLFPYTTLFRSPADAPEMKSSEISETALFSVLVVILGLYLTVTAGATLAGVLVEFLILKDATLSVQGPSITRWAALVASALEFILGLVLLLRLNGLKGIYFKLKHGGLGHDSKLE